jgi:drug/metabolite transporter (DMT)-like permease
MGWIFFSLLAALLWAIVNVIDKYTMSKLVESPLIPLLISGILGLFVAGGIWSVHGIETLSYLNLILAVLAGSFYVLTMYFYYLALQHEEVSKVIPIYYLSPVFILFFAKGILGENLTTNQYVGMAFLVSGAVLISAELPRNFKGSKGITYMMVAALCYALNQVLTKYLLKYNEFWTVFAYIRVGIFLSLLPIFYLNFNTILIYCKKIHSKAYKIMTVNQLLNLAGVFAITLAMTSGYVTLVNALASVQPIFVLIITLILCTFLPNILKETLEGWVLIKKFMATIFIVIGAWMLS